MKTVCELREILSEQLDELKANKTTVAKANAVVNAIGKFLHSIRLQLEYAKLKGTVATVSLPLLEGRSEQT